ncbi:unnamed protein product [Ambrosiozyma monospora]|uniref:Unnamed protein product n=1 Tax=Ambrosiozyma monospora TaxID=43982 RepID=A0ACB5TKC8_AMBMO|nr:unnamed protein product [Ambrosiozyma monospora]
MYVNSDLIPVYKDILRDGLVNLVTPNQFEIETLTDMKILTADDLKLAVNKFYQLYNVKNVVVTSVQLENNPDIYCVGSAGDGAIFYFKMEQIDAVFSGSGDFFLGLLTDCFVKYNGDLVKSLKETITIVTKVLQLTYDLCTDGSNTDQKRYIGDKLYLPDLKLIESKEILLDQHMLEANELVPVFI